MRTRISIVLTYISFFGALAVAGLIGAALGFWLDHLLTRTWPALSVDNAALIGHGAALLIAVGLLAPVMAATKRRITGLQRRLAQQDVLAFEAVREPFTLYLRAFGDDALGAASAPTRAFGFLREHRYETLLMDAIKPIAPVVAVGEPGEMLPQTGAARLYLPHEIWKDSVRDLIRRAEAVAVMVGDTEGVWWEIETVLSDADPSRLTFVFPYARRSDQAALGFYRRSDRAGPQRGEANLARLMDAISSAGLGEAPPPRSRDHILIVDPKRGPRWLRTRRSWMYWGLIVNPLVWTLMALSWVLFFLPWRFSLDGEIAYGPTFAPFRKRVRALGRRAKRPAAKP